MTVKKLSKLILFFSSTFIITFLIVAGIKFLSLRVEWAKFLPARPETALTLILAAAHWALSLSLFSSIIIVLNYSVRKKFSAIMSVIIIMVLSFSYTYGISFLLNSWKSVPPAQTSGIILGDNGLILTNALNKNETAVVLLNGTVNPLGPRVVAIPGQPLVFQRAASGNFELPPVPFGDDTPWFLKSISIDIRLNAQMFQQKFSEGFISFFVYAGSLIFLLCSLGYVIKFSVWPLANLFLAALAFHGVLAFNTFINTPEMQEITGSFLNNIIPPPLMLPLFFLSFGILLNIYSLLSFAAKRRSNDDY